MANPVNRQEQILELLKDNDDVRISELSDQLGVSEATVRRDLEKLVISGHIERNHGSAKLARPNPPEPPVIQRAQNDLLEKQRIGHAAAELIGEGESVFIGSGTTAMEVARNLCGRKNLTVITNAETVTSLLAKEEGITLVSTGGLLRHSELSYLGHITVMSLKQLRPHKVIMGIRSISVEEGLTSDYLPEVDTDQAIFRSGSELILVADHTKFGKVSPAFVAPVSIIDILVTDNQTSEETVTELRELGIKVIVC